MRQNGNPAVRASPDRQHIGTLYSTTVTLAELRLGLAILPVGKRRGGLQSKLDERVSLFAGDRILRFDVPAAENYATITARARETGTAVEGVDGEIAAIARHKGFTVATLDTRPFAACGVNIIDPWESADPPPLTPPR